MGCLFRERGVGGVGRYHVFLFWEALRGKGRRARCVQTTASKSRQVLLLLGASIQIVSWESENVFWESEILLTRQACSMSSHFLDPVKPSGNPSLPASQMLLVLLPRSSKTNTARGIIAPNQTPEQLLRKKHEQEVPLAVLHTWLRTKATLALPTW